MATQKQMNYEKSTPKFKTNYEDTCYGKHRLHLCGWVSIVKLSLQRSGLDSVSGLVSVFAPVLCKVSIVCIWCDLDWCTMIVFSVNHSVLKLVTIRNWLIQYSISKIETMRSNSLQDSLIDICSYWWGNYSYLLSDRSICLIHWWQKYNNKMLMEP